MTTKINIQGIDDIIDPFYRYTITKLNVISQKNKTTIDNLDLICNNVHFSREPSLLIQFFKKKFNASFTYKNNILSTTRTNLSYKDFENTLREFIERFVLCGKCRLPETELNKDDKDNLYLFCRCCSHITKCNELK